MAGEPLTGVLEAALGLLVANDIHGGLPNGYCAVCQGQCLRTWINGPKQWTPIDCSCGNATYRPDTVTGRRQALRCRGCHHIVGRCTCEASR